MSKLEPILDLKIKHRTVGGQISRYMERRKNERKSRKFLLLGNLS